MSPTHPCVHYDLIQHKHNTHALHGNISFRGEVLSHLIAILGHWVASAAICTPKQRLNLIRVYAHVQSYRTLMLTSVLARWIEGNSVNWSVQMFYVFGMAVAATITGHTCNYLKSLYIGVGRGGWGGGGSSPPNIFWRGQSTQYFRPGSC